MFAGQGTDFLNQFLAFSRRNKFRRFHSIYKKLQLRSIEAATEEVIPILCGLNLLNLQAKLFQQFDLSLDRLTVGINSITLLKNLDQLCSCQEMFLISLFI